MPVVIGPQHLVRARHRIRQRIRAGAVGHRALRAAVRPPAHPDGIRRDRLQIRPQRRHRLRAQRRREHRRERGLSQKSAAGKRLHHGREIEVKSSVARIEFHGYLRGAVTASTVRPAPNGKQPHRSGRRSRHGMVIVVGMNMHRYRALMTIRGHAPDCRAKITSPGQGKIAGSLPKFAIACRFLRFSFSIFRNLTFHT